MKRDYLELKTCRTEKAEFIKGKEYVVLDTTTEYTYEYDFEVLPCYRVINERGGLEIVVPDQIFFPTHRLLQSIKEVAYSGVLDIESLVEGETYSVFNMNEEKGEPVYTILDNAYKLITYPTSLFVSEDVYLEKTKEQLNEFKKIKKEEILEFQNLRDIEEQKALDVQLELENVKKNEAQKSIDEQKRLQDVKELNKIEIEKFKEFIKILRPNVVENTVSPLNNENYKITRKLNKISIFFITGCLTTVVSSIVGGLWLSSILNSIFLIAGTSTYLYFKNEISEDLTKDNLTIKEPNRKSLSLMVSFSDDILLKLKKIELNLLLLESGTTISCETILLIRESVSFCMESYKIKDTNLLKDIYVFLDKTLEYTYSLIAGDNIAELSIEKQVYDNVSSIIKRNTDVFEIMISDNQKINEILEKKKYGLQNNKELK